MPGITVGNRNQRPGRHHYEDRGFGQSVALIHGLRLYDVDVLGGTRISEQARS